MDNAETPIEPTAEQPSTVETVVTPQAQPEAKPEKPSFDLKKLIAENPELQAILDRQAGDARKEGRERERKKLLEELGISDVDSAKNAIKTAEEKRLAELSEIDQLKALKEAAERERDAMKQAQAEALEKTKAFLIANEIKAIAAELNFNDAEDLKSFLDRSKIEVDLDNTTVSGIRAQAESLVKAKPYLVKQTVVPVVDAKPENPSPALPHVASPQQKKKLTEEEKRLRAFRPKF